MLIKFPVKQVKWNQLLQQEAKWVLVEEFLFHFLLESHVSEIIVKQISVNQEVGLGPS